MGAYCLQYRLQKCKLDERVDIEKGLIGSSDLKTYLLMRWWGPHALGVCRDHRGLPVGFLLLRYSVLYTVESLSLLYLLFIS